MKTTACTPMYYIKESDQQRKHSIKTNELNNIIQNIFLIYKEKKMFIWFSITFPQWKLSFLLFRCTSRKKEKNAELYKGINRLQKFRLYRHLSLHIRFYILDIFNFNFESSSFSKPCLVHLNEFNDEWRITVGFIEWV